MEYRKRTKPSPTRISLTARSPPKAYAMRLILLPLISVGIWLVKIVLLASEGGER